MKKKERVLTVFVTAILCFSICLGFVKADETMHIILNGKEIDTQPVIINDRTYVPLRGFFEEIGANVAWDEGTRTAGIAMNTGGSAENRISKVIEEISPCVVGIIGNLDSAGSSGVDSYNQIVIGSGVIVKSGGEILTNAHVVEDLETILVVLSDGTIKQARVKAIDREVDLALIRIDQIGLPFATFAEPEEIVVGRTAIAIGTPTSFSLRNSATTGIVSGLNRSVSSSYRLIQTDTAINGGNSGGPLVNLDGKVMGINSSKFAAAGIEGLCFAIPADTVRYFMNSVEKYGRIRRPSLGATFQESWASVYGMPGGDGLTIKTLDSGSPLAAVGVTEGWHIIKIADREVEGLVDVNEIFKDYIPGDTVPVTFTKPDGSVVTLDITLAE